VPFSYGLSPCEARDFGCGSALGGVARGVLWVGGLWLLPHPGLRLLAVGVRGVVALRVRAEQE
jgi:hypothetical protein